MRVSRGPLSRGILIATVLATTLSGCAATQTGNMWRDSTFEAQGFKNMLVIAVRNDQTRRRMWEDNFALGLVPYGIKVQMSYRLWPTSLPDTAAVIEAIKRDGFDGVLISHHQNVETRRVPGSPSARRSPRRVGRVPTTRIGRTSRSRIGRKRRQSGTTRPICGPRSHPRAWCGQARCRRPTPSPTT
jgi:hypothetical protein